MEIKRNEITVTFKDESEAARFIVWWISNSGSVNLFECEFGHFHGESTDVKQAIAKAAYQTVIRRGLNAHSISPADVEAAVLGAR